MNRQIAFYCGLLVVISCTRNNSTSVSIETTRSGETKMIPIITKGVYERHELFYSDSIVMADTQIKFDTAIDHIICRDTITSYFINRVTKEVVRFCRQPNEGNDIGYLLLGRNKITWNINYGNPDEFIGPYLFSNIYRGGENGGTITKMKFKIAESKLQLVDSIIGGEYSEGAGTWEWLISDTGKPQTIMFHGGDLWSVKNDKLLITPSGSKKTHLVNLASKDTILSLLRPDRDIWDHQILENGILFSTGAKPRLDFLKLYDFSGKLLWTANSDYLPKLLVVAEKRLIIASGYYFPKDDNTMNYFTVAYDLDSGQMKWSFPTQKAILQTLDLTTFKILSFSTTSLFTIGDGIYGMIVEILMDEHNSIKYDNKLILFNAKGNLYKTIDLSKTKQVYSIINTEENEFQIVSNYENWSVKVYAP